MNVYDFSTRVSNTLHNLNLLTRDDVVKAVEEGRLKNFRNCGKKSFNEILAWLAATAPPPSPILCPHCGKDTRPTGDQTPVNLTLDPKREMRKERLRSVLALRSQGMTFENIGMSFGFSTNRANQLWHQANHMNKSGL